MQGASEGGEGEGPAPVPGAFVVAVAMVLGIAAAGEWGALARAGPALGEVLLGAAAALGALALLPRQDGGRWACVAGSALCIGVVLGVSDRAAGLASAQREGVLCVEGLVASAPQESGAGSDELGAHQHATASVGFELAVDAVHRSDGTRVPVRADLRVRVHELGPLPPRGSRVRVTGWHRQAPPAANPGARAPDGDGSLSVARRAGVVALEGAGESFAQRMRGQANASLDAAMPSWSHPSWRALVKAMTTGVRDPPLAEPAATFRMAGMSHVLAISGFNVGVLVALATGAVALAGLGGMARSLAALATAVLFLAMTEPEVSVLRAGLGAGVAAAAGLRGGQARGLGTLGAAACVTLALEPSSLFGPGFQLSYGVVLGLLTLAHAPCERWAARARAGVAMLAGAMGATGAVRVAGAAGAPHDDARAPLGPLSSWTALAASALAQACISSLVAFTVSTPIALWHGGFASAFAAPISVLTMPAAALVTVGGVAAIAVGQFSAVASLLPGAAACACAASLDWVARASCEVPGSIWWTGRPSLWWVVASLAAVVALWVGRPRAVRLGALASSVVLAALVWQGVATPHAGGPPSGTLRVDAIDTGDGACLLVRSARTTLLVDAGGSSDSAGTRRIVPALAALGVRRVDALVVTHDRLAHFSAVPEVVRAFGIHRVLVPGSMLGPDGEPDRGTSGAARALVLWLRARGVPCEPQWIGDEARVGDLAMLALWPSMRVPMEKRADGSMALQVALAQGGPALVTLGGLGREGCAALLHEVMRRPGWCSRVHVVALPRGKPGEPLERLLAAWAHPALLVHDADRDRAERLQIDHDGRVERWQWDDSGWRSPNEQGAVEPNEVADRAAIGGEQLDLEGRRGQLGNHQCCGRRAVQPRAMQFATLAANHQVHDTGRPGRRGQSGLHGQRARRRRRCVGELDGAFHLDRRRVERPASHGVLRRRQRVAQTRSIARWCHRGIGARQRRQQGACARDSGDEHARQVDARTHGAAGCWPDLQHIGARPGGRGPPKHRAIGQPHAHRGRRLFRPDEGDASHAIPGQRQLGSFRSRTALKAHSGGIDAGHHALHSVAVHQHHQVGLGGEGCVVSLHDQGTHPLGSHRLLPQPSALPSHAVRRHLQRASHALTVGQHQGALASIHLRRAHPLRHHAQARIPRKPRVVGDGSGGSVAVQRNQPLLDGVPLRHRTGQHLGLANALRRIGLDELRVRDGADRGRGNQCHQGMRACARRRRFESFA